MNIPPPGLLHRPGRFAAAFICLSLTSGVTIGMNKILVTLMALRLEAEAWQIGLLISAESLSMMLMSLPAGMLITHFGARSVYAVSSLAAMCLYPLVAYAPSWYAAAGLLFLAGICIPFRVVSMNTSWLERLPELGASKGGWYRGALMLGIGLLGPLAGNFTANRLGVRGSYWVTSGLFAFMALYGFLILSRTTSVNRHEGVFRALSAMLGQLRNPVVREVCTYDGMASVVQGFLGVFVIVIAVRVFHWSEPKAVMVMVAAGSMFVFTLFVLAPFAFRLGEKWMYDLGHAGMIGGLLVLGLTTHGNLLFVGALLHACGHGLNQLVNIARISHCPGHKGHISGLQTMVGMGGGFAGAAVGGLLSKGMALQDIFLLWIPLWLLICPGFRRVLQRGARKLKWKRQ
ncbi:MAG: MFS transporter [Zoogloeaceae bacterium]|jgi:MFS family permease|nr:MFS transporter [Zoogloeaceae bacterium]